MILSHRIQLDPTYKQAEYFQQACGTVRFVWNWALAEWKWQYADGKKPHGMSLKKQFNAIKYQQFPWLRGVHRDAHARPFADLQAAFSAFFAKRAKYPKFKKRGKCRESFYVAADRIHVDEQQVQLPVIGWVRMREALRFSGRIMSATVHCEAGRWYVAVQVDVGEYKKDRTGNDTVGVDLGIATAVVLSTGAQLAGPRPLRSALKRLRRLSRAHSRKQRGSKRRAKSQRRLARLHKRIKDIRNDFLHKVTTRLCRENQAVAIEDLHAAGMMKNRRLARALSDIGFHEFRRQMAYKSVIYDTRLVVADRWYPSSKLCSRCGTKKADLSLSQRVFRCEACGLALDRDVNAARNLEALCTGGLPGIDARGPDGSAISVATSRDETRTTPCSLVGTN